jgi:hypothetical protein
VCRRRIWATFRRLRPWVAAGCASLSGRFRQVGDRGGASAAESLCGRVAAMGPMPGLETGRPRRAFKFARHHDGARALPVSARGLPYRSRSEDQLHGQLSVATASGVRVGHARVCLRAAALIIGYASLCARSVRACARARMRAGSEHAGMPPVQQEQCSSLHERPGRAGRVSRYHHDGV